MDVKQTVEEIAPTIKEIAKLKRNIKRKHKELTLGREVSEDHHAKRIKPLTEPLGNIVEALKKPPPPPAAEPLPAAQRLAVPVRQHKHHALPTPPLTPIQPRPLKQALKQLQLPDIGEETPTSFEAFGDDSHFSPAPSTSGVVRKLWSNKDSPLSEDGDVPGWSTDEEEDQQNKSVQQLMDTSQDVVESEFDQTELAKTPVGIYVKGLIRKELSFDDTFGPKVIDNSFRLGSKILTFGTGGSKIVLTDPNNVGNEQTFDATQGLCELIFRKLPSTSKVTLADKKAYVDILEFTNVYRDDYAAGGRIRDYNNIKYKRTILPLLKKGKKKGKGISGRGLVAPFNMVANNDTKIEYVYYNDPNELVDRLQLLDQSKAVGNTGHENEINSILEELVEGGYIVGNPAN